MKIVTNNPYRIVGVLVGTTAREQDRQIKRLKQFIEAEQEPQDDFSFPALGNLHRTLDSIEEAASTLNLDSDKVNAALFWFWGGNLITDEAAFDALKDGNIEAAYQIWYKLTTKTDEEGKMSWNNVTKKNFSAFHNSAVLSLITNKESFVSAVVANIKFIESDYFEHFIKDVVDETYKVVKKEIELDFLKAIFDSTDNNKTTELVKYLNKYNFVAKQDFLQSVVQKPIEQIEQKIETAKNKRKASKSNAAKAGKELFTTTANDLTQLKSIVGAGDLKYSSVADKVANEILQCSIDYFNDSQEKDGNDDYAEMAMKLAKQAETVAVGNLIKGRVKDSINTLEEMKDREISQAIELLKSVKDAYEQACREIDKQVDELQYYTFGDKKIPNHNVSINWSKVEETKRNALDWEKVVELIKQVIPLQNIEKIMAAKNQGKINEYKSLVNFLMGKIDSLEKYKIQYLVYWSLPSRTQKQTSSSSISPSNNSNEKNDVKENNGCGELIVAFLIAIIIVITIVEIIILVF